MAKYVELIDKYKIVQSEDTDYNPPSYEWVDNTGEIVRCRDCKYWFNAPAADGFNSCERDALIRHEDFFCAAGEKREES